jgi:Anp1
MRHQRVRSDARADDLWGRNMATSNATVLILTPMKNTIRYLDTYFTALEHLTYPHNLLSLGILEGDSNDDTFAKLRDRLASSCANFNRKQLCKLDLGQVIPPDVPRYHPAYQETRRAVLARARNQLLFRALEEEDWVLWIDADVIEFPVDIVQRLIGLDRDIVHPHCVTEYGGKSFDRNAWRDDGRLHMQDLRGSGCVRLDSVGGTMLLVRADRHRDGLVFPPFFYGGQSRWVRSHHPLRGTRVGEIETEGLGVMAKDMGIECWGLPDLEILHAR